MIRDCVTPFMVKVKSRVDESDFHKMENRSLRDKAGNSPFTLVTDQTVFTIRISVTVW